MWKLIPDKIKHATTLSAFLKPRLNLGPSTTAHVKYAKYLLRNLVLLKFVRVSNGIHTSANEKMFKRKLRTLRIFTQLDL